MTESKPYAECELHAGIQSEWDVQPVIEQVWSDLGGTVSRTAICQELAEVIPALDNAQITTHVPIFVRQLTVARLRTRPSEFTEKLA
jgi:hypothetical protein